MATLTYREGGHEQWRDAEGHLHREDGPAITYGRDGMRVWYKHGVEYKWEYPKCWLSGWVNGEYVKAKPMNLQFANGVTASVRRD